MATPEEVKINLRRIINDANAITGGEAGDVVTVIDNLSEGFEEIIDGIGLHAEAFNGNKSTSAQGDYSHVEGYENIAYGGHNHAEGGGNITGLKGYYIDSFSRSARTISVGLEQKNPPTQPAIDTGVTVDYKAGDLLDVYVNGTYMHQIEITAINGSVMTFAPTNWNTVTDYGSDYDNSDRFKENYLGLQLDPTSQLRVDSNAIYCLDKPSIGLVTLKEGAHVEGRYNKVYSREGHAEGAGNEVLGNCAHAEGYRNHMGPWANNAHAEGQDNVITGSVAHVEGIINEVTGDFAHAEGNGNKASGNSAHIEGTSFEIPEIWNSDDIVEYSYSESSGTGSHVEGVGSSTVDSDVVFRAGGEILSREGTPYAAHAEGALTRALKLASHAEGLATRASERYAHAEGRETVASGVGAHAENKATVASGNNSHAEGDSSKATGNNAHAEGWSTTASGNNSHSEGGGTIASGESSHAEGSGTSATFHTAHAEGWKTKAEGQASHAEGNGTVAKSLAQHVQGKWNEIDTSNRYAHIVGGGNSDGDRKNIHTIDWDGNAYFKGSITIEDSIGKMTLTADHLRLLLTLIT